ncbi:MAG: DUF3667 domain-containing protein [Bacteroidia bacterium]|nr:DUF3667 domain-containing protein [Bacteroidia bacterium]
MLCKNCSQKVKGNFCQNCGQKTNVGRIDFNYLIKEVPQSFFQLDRGFFFTVRELFLRPGHSLREFIGGKRKNFYKPIAFVLITSTLYVLSTYLMGTKTFMAEMLIGFTEGIQASDFQNGGKTVDWIVKNQSYLAFLVLPIFSLASYLAFIRSDYNYIEHLILNLYISGQQMLIYLMFSFIGTDENAWIATPIILGITYNIWTYLQFFNEKKLATRFWLIGLSYLIFFAIPFLILFIAGTIVNLFSMTT